MPDQVPAELAAERRAELMAAQQELHLGRNREMVGRTLDVLIEEFVPLKREAVGRTEFDAPDVDGVVRVSGIETAQPGAVIPVRITAADGYDLVGEPVVPETVD